MKVLIVDDHPMVRKGISSTLLNEEGIDKIEESSSVQGALNALSLFDPDISIIDLRLGKEDGLEIVNGAKKKGVNSKFIVLTSSSKRDDFIRAQEAGVDGYILKEAYIEDILYALNVVKRGKKFFDPEMLQNNMGKSGENQVDALTQREQDVLNELGRGLSNIQIADKLYISENTVKKHVSSILAKLSMSHRTEVALYANNLSNIDAYL